MLVGDRSPVSDGSNAFTYDIENRLVAASGAVNASLRYDPLGRLYEVTGASGTTRFLHGGDALVDAYGSVGTLLWRYVHGTGSPARRARLLSLRLEPGEKRLNLWRLSGERGHSLVSCP